MCLAMPMRVIRLLPEGKALVRQDELETVVDIALVENVKVGDHLIVHAGYAIEVLDEAEAEERLRLFDEIASEGRRKDIL
jgi:hydrogenase expression/formation protein HypC